MTQNKVIFRLFRRANCHIEGFCCCDLKSVQMPESGKPLYLLLRNVMISGRNSGLLEVYRHNISIAKIMGYANDLRRMFNDALNHSKLMWNWKAKSWLTCSFLFKQALLTCRRQGSHKARFTGPDGSDIPYFGTTSDQMNCSVRYQKRSHSWQNAFLIIKRLREGGREFVLNVV
jgi:hypothetical protein